jgi:hypothetical protein
MTWGQGEQHLARTSLAYKRPKKRRIPSSTQLETLRALLVPARQALPGRRLAGRCGCPAWWPVGPAPTGRRCRPRHQRQEQPPMASYGQDPARPGTPERSWAQLGAREGAGVAGSSATWCGTREAPCARAIDRRQQGASCPAAWTRPCNRRLIAAPAPPAVQAAAAADGPGCSHPVAVEEAALTPPAQLQRQARQAGSGGGRSAGCTRRPPVHDHRDPLVLAAGGESETASAAGRISGTAAVPPGPGQGAARISGPIDAGEPCVGVVVEDEDRVARRWLGRTSQRAPLEDRESSTRCRQSLEEAQAAMLSSGSLHFGSHAFSPASPYGLLLARARFRRFSRRQQW